MAEEEARQVGMDERLICFPLPGGGWGFLLFSFPYLRRAAGRRPQLDGSGLRRYHADSSVEAVKAHVYMFQPIDELGRYANWPIRFGNWGPFATPLRRFAYWMASMRTNVTTNNCDKGDH